MDRATKHGKQNFKLIGPIFSNTLRDMVNEARPFTDVLPQGNCGKGGTQANRPDLKNVQFYAYGASAPEIQLLGKMTETYGTVQDYLKRKLCIDLQRTITTDDVLMSGIVSELKRRKSNDVYVDHLALIFEENTFYGRILPQELERRFAPSQCGESLDCPWIHKLRYRKYLDGDDDFLPRMRARLHKIDDELRKEKHKLNAIGILGSDVVDKLLVLRALRADFPEALFFTTDFDEVFTRESELPWTRNLIISSSFGPNFSDKFQRALPSFKDSYQMSAFVATLLATGNPANPGEAQDYLSYQPDKQRSIPLVFEIEQSGFLNSLP